jgi:hypothetical protein
LRGLLPQPLERARDGKKRQKNCKDKGRIAEKRKRLSREVIKANNKAEKLKATARSQEKGMG